MCRLLMVRSKGLFDMGDYLASFAEICRASREYQGHGFGVAFRRDGRWEIRKDLRPIWEADHSGWGSSTFMLAHARSAFRNEGICVENNMPFEDGGRLFAFNGELHGVKVKSPGRTGAEKIFQYILRFNRGSLEEAFPKAVGIILERTRYVRAMNIVMTDGERVYLSSHFGEAPDYFTLHHLPGEPEVLCSEPMGSGWQPVPNHTVQVI